MAILFETSLGEFTVDLFIDDVPLLACNILKLCKIKYYNNSLFHRVEKDFLVRAGLSSNNLSSDSILSLLRNHDRKEFEQNFKQSSTRRKSKITYSRNEGNKKFETLYDVSGFNLETGLLHEHICPKLKHDRRGIIGMANDRANEIGSAFYITLRNSIDYLNNKRSIIGIVSEGADILDIINNVPIEDPVSARPLQPIRIFHTYILDDPFPDPPGLAFLIPEISPLPIILDPESNFDISSQNGTNTIVEAELLQLERTAKLEARSRAVTLEVLGDLPDADLAPPDNVLFVCKLNSVTESADLELIFSRFGEIINCEVIRDWKTGDSLQYAFIEFADRAACEKAYFKMEGCLIDDRRIHVDFCQSVAKKWKLFRQNRSRRKP